MSTNKNKVQFTGDISELPEDLLKLVNELSKLAFEHVVGEGSKEIVIVYDTENGGFKVAGTSQTCGRSLSDTVAQTNGHSLADAAAQTSVPSLSNVATQTSYPSLDDAIKPKDSGSSDAVYFTHLSRQTEFVDATKFSEPALSKATGLQKQYKEKSSTEENKIEKEPDAEQANIDQSSGEDCSIATNNDTDTSLEIETVDNISDSITSGSSERNDSPPTTCCSLFDMCKCKPKSKDKRDKPQKSNVLSPTYEVRYHSVPQAQQDSDTEVESKSETVVQPKSAIVAQPKSAIVAQPKSAIVAQPKSATAPPPKSATEASPKSATEASPKSAAEAPPKSAAEAPPKSAAEAPPKSAAEAPSKSATPKSATESSPKSATESSPKSAIESSPKSPTGDVPKASTGAIPKASTGAIPKASTGAIPKASTGAIPKASTGAIPKSPTRAAPKSPTRAAPKSPTRAAPKSPTRAAPKSPTRAAPKSPTRAAPKSPTRAAPKSPTRAAPKSPTRAAPKSPTRAAPKSPTRAAPKSPTRAAPKSPTRAAPKSPTGAAGTELKSPTRRKFKFSLGSILKSPTRVIPKSPDGALPKSPEGAIPKSPTETKFKFSLGSISNFAFGSKSKSDRKHFESEIMGISMSPDKKIQIIDYEKMGEDQIIPAYLGSINCYSILPESGIVMLVDVNLPVCRGFEAINENAFKASPLWNSTLFTYVGMFTISDFVKVLCHHYHTNPENMKAIESQTIATWRTITGVEDGFFKVIDSESLLEATKILVQKRIHRLPIINKVTSEVVFLLTKRRILEYMDMNFFVTLGMNIKIPSFFHKTIGELKVGTFDNIATVKTTSRLIDALDLFATRNVSTLPVLDENNKLADIFDKTDVSKLAYGKKYLNLEMPIMEAIEISANVESGDRKDRETAWPLTVDDTFGKAMQLMAQKRAHRIMVVNNRDDEKVVGIISLSDVLKFIVLDPLEISALRSTSNTLDEASGGAVGGASGGAVGGASGGAVGGASGGAVGGASGGAVGGASGGAVGGASGGAGGGASGGAGGGASGGAGGGASGGAGGGSLESFHSCYSTLTLRYESPTGSTDSSSLTNENSKVE